MSTRMRKLCKGDAVVILTEQAHIDAYTAKGWMPAAESAPVDSKPAAKKRGNPDGSNRGRNHAADQ